VPHYNLWEPCRFAKVPNGQQTYILNILWLQKEGAQIRIPKQSQGLTPTKNMGQGFILCSTLPAQWAAYQPHQVEMSSQGIMSSKETCNNQPKGEYEPSLCSPYMPSWHGLGQQHMETEKYNVMECIPL
jgi:hypothetical protein